MRRQAALTVLTVAIFLIGAWNVQSTSQAAADATFGKAYFAGGCFWCMEEAFEKVADRSFCFRHSIQEGPCSLLRCG